MTDTPKAASVQPRKPSANYDILDLTKLILSVFVVCIHTKLYPAVLHPWVRTAVPLFFLMSSYFFFKKLTVTEKQQQNTKLWNYVKRNLLLYLFYFVLLLPITVVKRGYLHDKQFVLHLLRDFFLNSTFIASWYIMASIIGTALVFFLAKRLGNVFVLILGILLNLGCWMMSSGAELCGIQKLSEDICDRYWSPYNCFFVSVLWIVLGKMIAESKKTPGQRFYIILTVVSALLLEAEYLLLHPAENQDDCYLMMIPFCIGVFGILRGCNQLRFRNAALFRKYSTMIYAVHGSIVMLARFVFEKAALNVPAVVLFAAALTASAAFGFIILWLEKYKPFRFLQYAH